MKLSISKLRQIISEELEVLMNEEGFSPKQTPKQATAERNKCIDQIVTNKKVKPDSGTTLVQAAARICTDTAKVGGATLDGPEDEEDKEA
tara:strand:- start:94 stop:363 length:270 start_codon:yes stop_codon:yes gene_type:complete